MLRFIKAVLFIVIALAVAFLSIANRQSVTVSLDPFSRAVPEFSFTAPFFLVLFGAVAFGVILGGIAAWSAQSRKRRELRHARSEIRELKAELEKERATHRPAGLPALDKVA